MKNTSSVSQVAATMALSLAALSTAHAQTIVASISGTPKTSTTIDGTAVTAGVTPLNLTYTFDEASVFPVAPGEASFDGYYLSFSGTVTLAVGTEGAPDFRSFGGPVYLYEIRVINDAFGSSGPVDIIQLRASTFSPNNLYQVEFQEPASTLSDHSIGSLFSFLNAGVWTPAGASIYSFFDGGNAGILEGNIVATSATVVPEPSAYAALAGIGAFGLAAIRRRRARG